MTEQEFKQRITDDYKLAALAQNIVPEQQQTCQLPLVALAHAFGKNDRYVSVWSDAAFFMASGKGDYKQFATPKPANLFALQMAEGMAEVAEPNQCIVCTLPASLLLSANSQLFAANCRLPIALVVWCPDGAMPVHNQLDKDFNAQIVHNNSFIAMCKVFNEQLNISRIKHIPSVTLVDTRITQPIDNFTKWLVNHSVATETSLNQIASAARQAADEAINQQKPMVNITQLPLSNTRYIELSDSSFYKALGIAMCNHRVIVDVTANVINESNMIACKNLPIIIRIVTPTAEQMQTVRQYCNVLTPKTADEAADIYLNASNAVVVEE